MKTYRTIDEKRVALNCIELFNAKTCFDDCGKPQNPIVPRGEWYCGNPECAVREIWVRAKLYDRDDELSETTELTCPSCGKRLAFHNWISEELLLLVED